MNDGELNRKLNELGVETECGTILAEYTSFRIGGPCRMLVKPKTITEMQAACSIASRAGIRRFLLGNGSNLLVSDEGFPGMVVRTAGLSRIELLDGNRIFCEAGAPLAKLCWFAQAHALSGLEFAFGIPGSVGGAIYMNAGAYGGEIKDVLQSVRFLGDDGAPGELPTERLGMSYRQSAFTNTERVILSGEFALTPGDPAAIRTRMNDVLARRKAKQPLEYPSAGSAFKRPEGNYASALIEQCGLKGRRMGGAQVSEKHSGFLINAGGATCRDVCGLIAEVQKEVFRQTGYRLECEIKKVGLCPPDCVKTKGIW